MNFFKYLSDSSFHAQNYAQLEGKKGRLHNIFFHRETTCPVSVHFLPPPRQVGGQGVQVVMQPFANIHTHTVKGLHVYVRRRLFVLDGFARSIWICTCYCVAENI